MNNGRIYLLRNDNKLIPMNEQPYDSEALLQQLLASHADLLAGEQMNHDAPRRWLLITREMTVPVEVDGAGRCSLDRKRPPVPLLLAASHGAGDAGFA